MKGPYYVLLGNWHLTLMFSAAHYWAEAFPTPPARCPPPTRALSQTAARAPVSEAKFLTESLLRAEEAAGSTEPAGAHGAPGCASPARPQRQQACGTRGAGGWHCFIRFGLVLLCFVLFYYV